MSCRGEYDSCAHDGRGSHGYHARPLLCSMRDGVAELSVAPDEETAADLLHAIVEKVGHADLHVTYGGLAWPYVEDGDVEAAPRKTVRANSISKPTTLHVAKKEDVEYTTSGGRQMLHRSTKTPKNYHSMVHQRTRGVQHGGEGRGGPGGVAKRAGQEAGEEEEDVAVIDLTKEKEEEKGPVQDPADFMCPIFLDLFEDPVVAEDGHTYSRAAIEGHFASGLVGRRPVKSPKTGLQMGKALTPNSLVRRMAMNYKEKSRPGK